MNFHTCILLLCCFQFIFADRKGTTASLAEFNDDQHGSCITSTQEFMDMYPEFRDLMAVPDSSPQESLPSPSQGKEYRTLKSSSATWCTCIYFNSVNKQYKYELNTDVVVSRHLKWL